MHVAWLVLMEEAKGIVLYTSPCRQLSLKDESLLLGTELVEICKSYVELQSLTCKE